MKIIQVMPEFGLAGAEIMAENLAYGLAEEGHKVVLISFYKMETPITDRLNEKGFKIKYLDKKQGFDGTTIKKLREIFKEVKPDVVHTHRYVLPYVYLASVGLPHKIVHTVHNLAEKEVGAKQQLIHHFLFKKKKVTPVAISPRIKDSILKRYRLKKEDVPMIFNGIDLSKCIVKENYELHDGGVILHIGRFSEQKNHKRVIDAFEIVHKSYPQMKLQLIGSGELEEEVKNYVKSKGIEQAVEFLGLQGNVYPFLNKADIFVLPSDYEGMPITLIEAMAAGLPIVATNVGGIPDMIRDGIDGCVCNTDSSDVADKLIKMIEDTDFRTRVAHSAEIVAEAFSLKHMTEGYIEQYSK